MYFFYLISFKISKYKKYLLVFDKSLEIKNLLNQLQMQLLAQSFHLINLLNQDEYTLCLNNL